MLPDRFWAKVNKAGPVPAHAPHLGPCHLWTGTLSDGRYGAFRVGERMRKAHVLAWEDKHGPVPEGQELDHLCRTNGCCNDEHVTPVTHRENVQRGLVGSDQRARTTCPQGHAYDSTNTRVSMRRGGGVNRFCRTCQRLRARSKREPQQKGLA